MNIVSEKYPVYCESCKNCVREWDGNTWHIRCKVFTEMEIELTDTACEEFVKKVVKAY